MKHIIAYATALLILAGSVQAHQVFAETGNLFANPSAEIIGAEKPQSWVADQWGTSRVIFSFPSVGAEDGKRYLQTQITKKGSGDAKWYPVHVPVVAGQAYTFSDWYASDVSSGVDVEYILSNGKYQYAHLANLNPSPVWKKYQATFTVPAKAKKLTILHYIDSVGTLNADNYSLTSGTSTGNGGGGTSTTTPPVQTIISVTNAPQVPSQQIAVNAAGLPLGGFTVLNGGEAASVHSMNFYLSTTSSPGLLTNVTLFNEDGAAVAGPIDASYDPASGKQLLSFNDTVTFQPGAHFFILKGKLPSTFSSGATITASTRPSVDWGPATGVPSGDAILLSTSTVVMSPMTAKASNLAIQMSSLPAAQTVVPGLQGFIFANVQLDATQSGEDIRISALPVSFAGAAADLSGCQLWDGLTALTTGSRVLNSLSTGGANNFFLDNSLTIAKGAVKTLAIACSVSINAAAGDTYRFGVDSSYSYGATGITSAVSFAPSVATGQSSLITVGTGSISLGVDTSSPAYTVVAGGSTGVTVGVIKLRATNEPMQIAKIGFALGSGSSTDLNSLDIYDGATQIGTAFFTGSNSFATSTLVVPTTALKDTDKLLTLKANLSSIGIGQSGTEGRLLVINPLNVEASGQASGLTFKSNATGVTAGLRIFKTFPTISADVIGNTGVSDGVLLRFKVTSNSAGSAGIGKFTFALATTSATVTNLRLYAYTDSVYSNSISGQGTSGLIGSSISGAANSTSFSIAPAINPVEIPAASTYYFELRGDVSGAGAGSAVTATLQGDSTFDGMKTASDVNSNFVWSPNATSTSLFTTNDWTNGFGLPGLPPSGISKTRTN